MAATTSLVNQANTIDHPRSPEVIDNKPASYRVEIIEQLQDESGKPLGAALISDAEFESDELESANAFVEQFNSQELDENAGLWAVVRLVPESDELPTNLLSTPADADQEHCDHLVVLVKPLCDSQGRAIRFASLELKWQLSERTARVMAKRWNKRERQAAATGEGSLGMYAIVIPAPSIPPSE